MSLHIRRGNRFRRSTPIRQAARMTSTDVARSASKGVRLSGLTKSFKSPQGPVHAVRGIDVTIPVGETVALLGPNGADKSTTIDMVLGLLAPDAGTIELFG